MESTTTPPTTEDDQFSFFLTKGRRTKRQRSSSSGCCNNNNSGTNHSSSTTTTTSTTQSDDRDQSSEVTTEEEQDMANCLILLAQGVYRDNWSENKCDINTTTTTNINSSDININTMNSGVYECKTCNRVFHSFQALGGHRASHNNKKPRPNTTTSSPPPPPPPSDHEDRDRDHDHDESEPLMKKTIIISTSNKVRVHECSICGSEFPSGQALGGHMRRHRAPAVPEPEHGGRSISIKVGRPKSFLPLDLDLNLPAPDDDDDQHIKLETKFHVLSTPALVDCHY